MDHQLRVNRAAVELVAHYLREPSSRELVERAELADPQLQSVARILSRFNQRIDAFFYTVGIAAISYQLTTKGEEHWFLAAEHAGGDPRESLRSFVEKSPSLKLARSARLARVERLNRLYPSFAAKLDLYLSDLEAFRKDLARALEADQDAKTIVFAVKMLYYAAKASGLSIEPPSSIPIPVDRRVCLISLTSRVVEGEPPTPQGARLLLSKAPKLVAEAWRLVCEKSGVPPIKLDALLWLLGGCYERAGSPEGALDCASKLLSPPPGAAVSLMRVLLGLSP
ncbi:MAG: N-glycosylase/DNA lyase [Thermofilaceae archaeon]